MERNQAERSWQLQRLHFHIPSTAHLYRDNWEQGWFEHVWVEIVTLGVFILPRGTGHLWCRCPDPHHQQLLGWDRGEKHSWHSAPSKKQFILSFPKPSLDPNSAASGPAHCCVLEQPQAALDKPHSRHLVTSRTLNQMISDAFDLTKIFMKNVHNSPGSQSPPHHLSLFHFGLGKATRTTCGIPKYPWSCSVPAHSIAFSLGTQGQHHLL